MLCFVLLFFSSLGETLCGVEDCFGLCVLVQTPLLFRGPGEVEIVPPSSAMNPQLPALRWLVFSGVIRRHTPPQLESTRMLN